ASTRASERRQQPARTVGTTPKSRPATQTKVKTTSHSELSAHSKPKSPSPPLALPVEASPPATPNQESDVQVVASDELNEIDRAADATPVETVGSGQPAQVDVRLVHAEEFNDLDRQAASTPQSAIDALRASKPATDAPSNKQVAGVSWWRWLW